MLDADGLFGTTECHQVSQLMRPSIASLLTAGCKLVVIDAANEYIGLAIKMRKPRNLPLMFGAKTYRTLLAAVPSW